jgi:hypothetical protein
MLMLTKFWEGLGGKLAEQWAARILTPAFAFWTGALAAWVWGNLGDDIRANGWTAALQQYTSKLQTLPIALQVALIVVILLALVTSAAVAERLTPPLLRILEGYWPARLGGWLQQRNFTRRQAAYSRAGALAGKRDDVGLTSDEDAKLATLEHRLRRTPATQALTMPTRLGNLLRAAEARPRERYGLDTVVCWPYLWLILDQDTKEELTQTRVALNTATRVWLWGALFAVWTVWAWWALPVAVVVCASTYYVSMLSAAEVYGDLLEATFALHRTALYAALRWPPPATPDEEAADGEAVTTYLWRGIAPVGLKFEVPKQGPP